MKTTGKKYGIFFITFAICLMLAACAPAATPDAPQAPTLPDPEPPVEPGTTQGTDVLSETAGENGITAQNYPRIDGSTSTFSLVWEIFDVMHTESENYPQQAMKTVPSYEALMNDELDMIFVPYASAEVLDIAKQKGIELEFHPVAAEALIFITSVENTAENITMEQVRDIYINYGITNWKSLGGPDRELVPISRNADSGSQSQMDNLILRGEPTHPDINENYVELTMEDMLTMVAFYHNGGMDGAGPTNTFALGYTLYSYLESMTQFTGVGESLKILAFDGAQPDRANIASGAYPLADAYYAVVRSDLPENHSARSIIAWLHSEEGTEAIARSGLISTSEAGQE